MVVGRIAAGLVGVFAFYLAFCLYEDEQGKWQNRLDELWVSIDDRSKVTDRTSTAIFNKVGQVLITALNRLFGARLVSFEAVAVSIDLSLGFLCLTALVVPKFFLGPQARITRFMLVFFLAGTAIMFALAFLPPYFQKKWATFVSFLPLIAASGWYFDGLYLHRVSWGAVGINILIPIGMSVISDLVAVYSIRRSFRSMAEAPSISCVVSTIGYLLIIVVIVFVLPLWVDFWGIGLLFHSGFHHSHQLLFSILGDASMIVAFNISTALLCLAPLVVLVVVLGHKLIWPTLARIVYPVARHKLVTNRKALCWIGGICLMIAFNLEYVGLKEILKRIGNMD
jgi:hypothetical protein